MQIVPFAQIQIAPLPEQSLPHSERESQHPRCSSPLVALLSHGLHQKVMSIILKSFYKLQAVVNLCIMPWWLIDQFCVPFSRKGSWYLFTQILHLRTISGCVVLTISIYRFTVVSTQIKDGPISLIWTWQAHFSDLVIYNLLFVTILLTIFLLSEV